MIEEKKNRDNLTAALKINNIRLWNISKMFIAAYEVDLPGDTFEEIKENNEEVRKYVGDEKTKARDFAQKVISGLADESCRKEVAAFVDFDTLSDRMRDLDTVTTEYLTTEQTWRMIRDLSLSLILTGRYPVFFTAMRSV